MADYAQSITLPDHKRGDRWIGIAQIGPVLIDGQTPAAALTRVRMMFRRRRGTQVFTIDSAADPAPDAPAVIDNDADWIASIPTVFPFVSDSGSWDWDIEFWDATETGPLTLYKGLLTVHNDVAR